MTVTDLRDLRDARVLAEQILTDLQTAESRLTDPDSSKESRLIARDDLDRAGSQAQELDGRINNFLAVLDDELSEDEDA